MFSCCFVLIALKFVTKRDKCNKEQTRSHRLQLPPHRVNRPTATVVAGPTVSRRFSLARGLLVTQALARNFQRQLGTSHPRVCFQQNQR